MNDEEFVQIEGAPGYLVNRLGVVIGPKRPNTPLVCSPLRDGTLKITLPVEGKPKQFLLRRIVANAFCERPTIRHNTVLHKDHDKTNCRADNLMWQPRMFAFDYVRQYVDPIPEAFTFPCQIVCLNNGNVYPNCYEAARGEAHLMYLVRQSCLDGGKPVLGMYQFEFLDHPLERWDGR